MDSWMRVMSEALVFQKEFRKWKRTCFFAPRPFFKTEQPKEDDIARCMCMRQLALPVFLCGKGSKGFAVTAVCFWVLHLFKHSTWWRPTQLGTTCVRDLVVVIRIPFGFSQMLLCLTLSGPS